MDPDSNALAYPLVACVPNFSEGRDLRTVLAILEAMRLPGVLLLDYAVDPVANRSVITIAGSPPAVCEAAVRSTGVAAERIDLTRQTGSHRRIGAADVIPFVPIESAGGAGGSSLLACAVLAREAAGSLWERYSIPSYLYEAAAARPDRVQLDEVRRGQFEGLREAGRRDTGRRSDRKPDVGGPGLHPTAGAAAVGARLALVEYTAILDTAELGSARSIAREMRNDAGGTDGVRASGLLAGGRVSVAIQVKVTRPEALALAHSALNGAARKYKTYVTGIELTGLVPRAAYNAASQWAEILDSSLESSGENGRRGTLSDGRSKSRILEQRLTEPLPWPARL